MRSDETRHVEDVILVSVTSACPFLAVRYLFFSARCCVMVGMLKVSPIRLSSVWDKFTKLDSKIILRLNTSNSFDVLHPSPCPTMSLSQPIASSSAPPAGAGIITQPPPPTATRESRIATHSHIKGLGLADDGTAMETSQGFVGQRSAREALGLHLALLKMGRHSGRPLLLVGPPGTGKVGWLLW